jgi:hypothetical protein
VKAQRVAIGGIKFSHAMQLAAIDKLPGLEKENILGGVKARE